MLFKDGLKRIALTGERLRHKNWFSECYIKFDDNIVYRFTESDKARGKFPIYRSDVLEISQDDDWEIF